MASSLVFHGILECANDCVSVSCAFFWALFLLSVCFVQFGCVSFCFILLYSINIPQKPVCFLMIQSGICLGESEEMGGVEGGDSIIRIYYVRILFSNSFFSIKRKL